MYRHVACLVDRSSRSARALREARRLALGGARLSAVHVDRFTSLAMASSAWVPDLADLREWSVAWLRAELQALGLDEADPVVLDSPFAVCAWARRARVDLLVVPRGGGAAHRLLCLDASGYLGRHAPCPVLIVDAGSGTTTMRGLAGRQAARA